MDQGIKKADIQRNQILTRLLNLHFWGKEQIQKEAQLKSIAPIPGLDYPPFLVTSRNDQEIYIQNVASCAPRYKTLKPWDLVPLHDHSWERYMNINRKGTKIALLVFCPYHPRPMTSEYAGKKIFYVGRQVPQINSKGSKMPFINVDLAQFRTLPEFLEQELQIPQSKSRPLLENLLQEARRHPLLQVTHDSRSNLKGQEPSWTPWHNPQDRPSPATIASRQATTSPQHYSGQPGNQGRPPQPKKTLPPALNQH